jgi:broad specificity phosphatase PhoE
MFRYRLCVRQNEVSSTMDSRTTLLFVRHAEVECRQDERTLLCGSYDVPLSEEGRRQVDLLRRRLVVERTLDAVYVSPLKRALETAEAAPEHLRPSVRILKSLAEIDCGTVDGFPIDHVRQQYPDLWLENDAQTNEDFSWPGGETYRRFRTRVMRAVKAISCMHTGQRVLVVTHAGVINQVLGSIIGQSAAKWESPRPRNTSVTRVIWGNDHRSIAYFDDCSHLHAAHAGLNSEAHIGSTDDPEPVSSSSVASEL